MNPEHTKRDEDGFSPAPNRDRQEVPMSPRAAESDEDVRRASTEPRLSRSEFGHPHNPRTDVRRLRFQLASTQSRLASAIGFSGGRVMPGHQHRTAT
jgi:hypothetical protein